MVLIFGCFAPETLEVCLLTGTSTAGPEAWQISWSLQIGMMRMMRMYVAWK